MKRNRYEDLNKFVQAYLVSREGGARELRALQKRLSNVPVDLRKFEKELASVMHHYEFADLTTHAELYDPQGRIGLLDELAGYDEADEITARMVLPFPVIFICGESISNRFYKDYQHKFGKLITPDKRDKTARVLSDPECNGVAVTFERDGKLHYIEMILTRRHLL